MSTQGMNTLYLIIPFAPLVGAIIAGLFGRQVGRAGAAGITILGVLISLICSLLVLRDVLDGVTFNGTLYSWAVVGDLKLEVGFLIDSLTAVIMERDTYRTLSALIAAMWLVTVVEDDLPRREYVAADLARCQELCDLRVIHARRQVAATQD